MHILPNISRSKSNQTMKFGHLMEYKKTNIFVEKSYTKCGGETIPRPFSKKTKLSISLDHQSKVLYGLFLLHANIRAIEIVKPRCRPFASTLYKPFLKNKKRSGTSLPVSFFV